MQCRQPVWANSSLVAPGCERWGGLCSSPIRTGPSEWPPTRGGSLRGLATPQPAFPVCLAGGGTGTRAKGRILLSPLCSQQERVIRASPTPEQSYPQNCYLAVFLCRPTSAGFPLEMEKRSLLASTLGSSPPRRKWHRMHTTTEGWAPGQ